ncbi:MULTISPECIES: signal recognition particle-docking protein FtsY [Bifidobacterium]|jgi:fused signal recognition particle receptor|uniref:Signal recognition particle receptor FtsY n=1 Tax=Bifidobacterium tibiigranuli TaxID=2172043 RepID=A0A5N6S3U5_9BIFI|nr:signal recognition particle-docking protein FtsY [Bifidobacterium tibiigranuli]KAE8129148.1 signal recognition particle-docking protein FtsY [Bifidobacterium tibiigranuli]KAE8129386.1 signal recognition particle-docking protein FtsY [Bifidobacterium tibiigranuli]MCH3975353.1 signal recognition particle-docking protein FtsY [Bifidobacterium tibiigranuli]MCH4189932.1 signal recognition particle-docking protein FtsY [Bifidobacterium tibiigranuli]MCH4203552.1 signal recognition particle-docking
MDTTMIIGIVVLVALVIAAVVAAVLVDRSHKRRATGAHDDSPSRTRSAQQPEAAAPATAQSSSEASKQQTAQSAASAPQQATTESAVNPTAESASSTPAERPVETPESAGSRIVRLKAKLAKSSNPFGRALFNILAKDHLSETDWEDVEDTLLLADVGADASAQLVEELRNDARVTGASDPAQVRDALRSKLLDLVGTDTDRRLNADKNATSDAASSDTANPDAAQHESRQPSVIIMVGVNGTGKTTTAGKLARLFVAEDKKVVMGAADTFRAAAADQLETWGAKVGVSVVRSDKDGADPASVAFDAAQQAKDANADVLIIDTAGRLQNKANLMNELGKIRRVAEKVLPVDEVLLVLDATTGQNGMAQAKVFAEAIGITGVVLSKLDGSAKGGIVIAVQKELGVPVKLVGLGEGPDDLAPFDAAAFVDGILA